ncbi:MAG: 3-phosphoshikimate 1-carboxyvinyltransferase [Candidatus Thermoplasmatota archaeon]|nr:3-phosphoshikimate 1-carboxyvinyltransferase [Candidatus Thermoplasmatota archaeon]
MKLLRVSKSSVGGSVAASPSKSYTHRAFIIGFLSGKAKIYNPLISKDTQATLNAIKSFGAEFKKARNFITIKARCLSQPVDIINVENSGTTLRLMTGVASLLEGTTILTGDDSIKKRPMLPLLNALNYLGASCYSIKKDGTPPIIVKGKIKGGSTCIRGDISSQFISSLLISTPLAEKDTRIILTTDLKSRPYLDITLEILKNFGIEIVIEKNCFLVKGAQKYISKNFDVPGDFSSASFLFTAAAITKGNVKVKNLNLDTKQGDKKILDILERFGAEVKIAGEEISVEGKELRGIELDCKEIPDLFPVAAVLGAYAKGVTKLKGAKHLRYKESDRISAMAQALKKMQCNVKELEDGILIKGGKELKGAKIDSRNDHRLLMACAVAALGAKGKTLISHPNCYKVSCPSFIKDLKKLGAEVRID